MAGHVVINRSLAELGISSARAHLTEEQADKKKAAVSRLAERAGVPAEVIHALVTGKVQRLATASPESLKNLHAYLSAAAEKPGTAAKGNVPLVKALLSNVVQATKLRAAKQVQLAREANKIVVETSVGLAYEHANRAANYALEARVKKLGDNKSAVQFKMNQRKLELSASLRHLKSARDVAQTAESRQIVAEAAKEIRLLVGSDEPK